MFPRFKINFRSLEGVIMISNICLLAMQLRCNQNDILDYSHCIYNGATRQLAKFFISSGVLLGSLGYDPSFAPPGIKSVCVAWNLTVWRNCLLGYTLCFALRSHRHQATILSLCQLFSSPVMSELALPPFQDRGREPAENPVVAEPAVRLAEAAVPPEGNEVIS